jgi:capsule polysaccharide export protein KpsC/LpsZ
MNIMHLPVIEETVAMLRQFERHRRATAVVAFGMLLLATIGLSAATGKAERSPECAQLARIVAGREHTMLDSQRFVETEQQAYGVCAQDPATFRKLIRVS